MPSNDPVRPVRPRPVPAEVESRPSPAPAPRSPLDDGIDPAVDARIDEFFNDGAANLTGSTPLALDGRSDRPPAFFAARHARRLRARKVHRVVRHVEPWSVLKLALVFYFCMWVVMLVAGTLLWRVANSTGVINNIESFVETIFVLDNFKLDGGQIFRAYAIGGLVLVLVATVFTTLAAVLFNLISDLIGGVRVTVIQEETARPEP